MVHRFVASGLLLDAHVGVEAQLLDPGPHGGSVEASVDHVGTVAVWYYGEDLAEVAAEEDAFAAEEQGLVVWVVVSQEVLECPIDGLENPPAGLC